MNAELDESLALGKRLPASIGREIQAAARNTVAKLKLDAYEQGIEDSIGRGEWKPLAGKEKAAFMAKLRAAHKNLKKGRGEARPSTRDRH